MIIGIVHKKNKAYLTQCASSTTKPASCPCDLSKRENQQNILQNLLLCHNDFKKFYSNQENFTF